jgi:hypothetical protein
MAFVFRKGYGSSTEQRRDAFFQTLSEKDRRRYAAMEAMKLGHGGIAYMARVLGCSRRTMEHGIAELETLPQDPAEDRIRRPGGGRKKASESQPDWVPNLFCLVEPHTAGDPMREDFYWTDLCLAQISDELATLGTPVCPSTVVAHYPTYCSKFNPLERRFFSHVTRACQGVLFDTLDTVVNLMRKTATKTGLTTTVRVMKKVYETGRKATQDFRDTISFRWDKVLPKWNYTAIPQ